MTSNNPSTVWIKNPLAVFAENAEGGIVLKDQKILELVPLGQSPKNQIDVVYDASDSVLLPGLINTHHHFYQTLTRAYPEALNKELFPWLKSLYKVWANIQPEMIAVSTELALSELLLSGSTTTPSSLSNFAKCWRNARLLKCCPPCSIDDPAPRFLRGTLRHMLEKCYFPCLDQE